MSDHQGSEGRSEQRQGQMDTNGQMDIRRRQGLKKTPQNDVLFIIGTGMPVQETPGVPGKFGLGVQNEAGQRLIEFCQENTLKGLLSSSQHPKFPVFQ